MSADRATDGLGPLGRRAIEFQDIVARTVAAAKEPGFGPDGWSELAAIVDVDRFERVGTWLEVMDWDGYTQFLTKWAAQAEFATVVRRVSELPGLVYLEIEEHHGHGDAEQVVNSLSVLEFEGGDDDGEGRIVHLDVYLQAPR
jgi:hypothetical protein